MYRVLIVENELMQLTALHKILTEYQENFAIYTAIDYNSAITKLCKIQFDLFFLNIKLQENRSNAPDGIALGKYIRSLYCYCYTPIIFITSIPEKIYEAINDTNCFYYLLKPYTKEAIFHCLDNTLHSPLMKESSFVFQSFWGNKMTLKENDILFFTRNSRRNIVISTVSENYETNEYTLNQLEHSLTHNFCRCHRQYLVNIAHVKAYNKTRQELMIEDAVIPVGRKYKSQLENALKFLI